VVLSPRFLGGWRQPEIVALFRQSALSAEH
jgi:hypothetical protein